MTAAFHDRYRMACLSWLATVAHVASPSSPR